MENPESKAGEEVPWRQISGNRPNLKASLSLQKLADILQLRNMILAVTAVFDQLRPIGKVFGNRMFYIELLKFHEDRSPSLYLGFLCVEKN